MSTSASPLGCARWRWRGLEMKLPNEIAASRDGSFTLNDGSARVAFGSDGSFEAQVAEPNRENREQLAQRRVLGLAQESLKRYGLDRDVTLVPDRVRLLSEAGGTDEGSGERVGPFVTETTVQFRQVINGLPVISPDAGTVRVTLDNDGTVTNIHSATRIIDQLSDRPRSMTSAPEPGSNGSPRINGSIARARATNPECYERLLSAEWGKRMAAWAVKGHMPEQTSVVPGTTEVGYDIRGNEAVLVAKRAVEVDFGGGFRKRYWVTTDLLA